MSFWPGARPSHGNSLRGTLNWRRIARPLLDGPAVCGAPPGLPPQTTPLGGAGKRRGHDAARARPLLDGPAVCGAPPGIQTHSTQLVHVVNVGELHGDALPLLSGGVVTGLKDDRRARGCGPVNWLQALVGKAVADVVDVGYRLRGERPGYRDECNG